jgi:hypothetical protein
VNRVPRAKNTGVQQWHGRQPVQRREATERPLGYALDFESVALIQEFDQSEDADPEIDPDLLARAVSTQQQASRLLAESAHREQLQAKEIKRLRAENRSKLNQSLSDWRRAWYEGTNGAVVFEVDRQRAMRVDGDSSAG